MKIPLGLAPATNVSSTVLPRQLAEPVLSRLQLLRGKDDDEPFGGDEMQPKVGTPACVYLGEKWYRLR